MKCRLKECDNEAPSTRKRSAKYCSYACYYEGKKQRSIASYNRLKQPSQNFKKNENILAFFYEVQQLGKAIYFEDLQKKGFDWGLSAREVLGPDKIIICKAIGSYCYYLHKDKTIQIWKLKPNP